MEVLIASYGGHKETRIPSQKRSMIWKKQLKQCYRESGWNEDQNERRMGESRNHMLGQNWWRNTNGDGRS